MEVHTVFRYHKHVCFCRCFMSYYYFNTLQHNICINFSIYIIHSSQSAHTYIMCFLSDFICRVDRLWLLSCRLVIDFSFVSCVQWSWISSCLDRLLWFLSLLLVPFFSITSLKQPIYQFKRKILFATEARSHFLDVTFYHMLFLSLSLCSLNSLVHVLCTILNRKKELTFRSKQLFRTKSTTWKMVLKWKKNFNAFLHENLRFDFVIIQVWNMQSE